MFMGADLFFCFSEFLSLDMGRSPLVQSFQNRDQAQAVFRDGIFHFRRNLRINDSVNDLFLLQFTQMERKHPLHWAAIFLIH